MQNKVLMIIDIQNDITKNYKEMIDNINKSVDWAVGNGFHVVYIRHENLSAGTRNLKPNTFGSELASDLKVVSDNVFTKFKGNALTSVGVMDFISKNWQGTPLISLAVILSLIGATKTENGLAVSCVLDESTYKKGLKVTDEELAAINITRAAFHGDWNYRIAPCNT
jgi:hypothetical protein